MLRYLHVSAKMPIADYTAAICASAMSLSSKSTLCKCLDSPTRVEVVVGVSFLFLQFLRVTPSKPITFAIKAFIKAFGLAPHPPYLFLPRTCWSVVSTNPKCSHTPYQVLHGIIWHPWLCILVIQTTLASYPIWFAHWILCASYHASLRYVVAMRTKEKGVLY